MLPILTDKQSDHSSHQHERPSRLYSVLAVDAKCYIPALKLDIFNAYEGHGLNRIDLYSDLGCKDVLTEGKLTVIKLKKNYSP